jgi:hypothetical protein
VGEREVLMGRGGVFTELIAEIGVEDVQVEELWSFDLESLQMLK